MWIVVLGIQCLLDIQCHTILFWWSDWNAIESLKQRTVDYPRSIWRCRPLTFPQLHSYVFYTCCLTRLHTGISNAFCLKKHPRSLQSGFGIWNTELNKGKTGRKSAEFKSKQDLANVMITYEVFRCSVTVAYKWHS